MLSNFHFLPETNIIRFNRYALGIFLDARVLSRRSFEFCEVEDRTKQKIVV